jgi:hypothetical protein
MPPTLYIYLTLYNERNILFLMLNLSKLNQRDLNKDLYLSLSWNQVSKNIDDVFCDFLNLLGNRDSFHPKSFQVRLNAFCAYLFDLLLVRALGPDEWGYRSFCKDDFKGKRIGYRPFKWVHDRLRTVHFIEQMNGFHARNGGSSYSTRVRPTAAFLEFMLKHGITPYNFRLHFKQAEPFNGVVADPIRVRASKTGDWLNLQKGKRLPVDLNDPRVAALAAQVQNLNEWFVGHRIEHPTNPLPMHAGFYRSYSQGDQPAFAFDKGGRLYNLGGYQRIEREERRAIRINGEAAVEVDVSSSHLTILHGLMGVPLHPSADSYTVAGIDRRSVVKRFVTMTLGNGGFQKRWPKAVREAYLEDDLKIKKTKTVSYRHTKKGWKAQEISRYTKEQLSLLQRDYPLSFVRQAVLKHLPILARFPQSGITWADLQYCESLGLIATVEALAYQHGIPALPLHDSVIVPISKAGLAQALIMDAFWKQAGVRIKVTVK